MAKQKKFGTFGGVFTPSILTILGVIMYLRLPMIVGQAGLWATIGIILVAHIISVTTGLSVSSIATDKKVEAGGTYYMISRSLGLPIGGTLGIALFVGLSFSVSLYLIGFSESFLNFWGLDNDINSIRLTGTIVLIAVTTLTFISTSLAIKTQYFIMAAIVLSLLSIFLGDHEFAPDTSIVETHPSTVPLMVLFGIFFPAVTGFEAGVSMSGDLKDPKRSIPLGAILAILVGLIVYIGETIYFSSTVRSDMLVNDPNILLKISWIPELVVAGIWGATLSSALGSILGAPRILQATASDAITPKFFSKGYGPTHEPRNALLLTFLIAEAGILIGELDVIARIVSIFFITTYGFLNTSAAFESWTSADFRPEFKVPGWISATGAIACILVMIQLDFLAMMGAAVILGLLFLYLKRKELTLDSGDAWSGVWASLVRTGLTRLKSEKIHSRNWRPNIIMFSGNPETRKHMVDMGQAISGKLGILSAFELVPGSDHLLTRTQSILEMEKDTPGYFHHKLFCHDVFTGIDEVSRLYGFSGVEPNTILMGWSKNKKTRDSFIHSIRNFDQHGYNSLFLNYDPVRKYGQQSTIDIWWSGTGRNLTFAINLIRHISSSKLWRSAKIRVMVINPLNENHDAIYKSLKSILENYRVDAEINIINNQIAQWSETEIITTESRQTDLVILGVPDRKFRNIDQYFDQITQVITNLGSTLIINASENFETLDIMGTSIDKYHLEEVAEIDPFTLPPLRKSKHPEIAHDIQKTDINYRKVIELFYAKSFRNLYLDRLMFLDDIYEKAEFLIKEIKRIGEIKESFRRRKAIDKLKNDTIFKINEIISEGSKKEKLPIHIDQLREGISWYVNRLESDFKKYPKNLIINYAKEEFSIEPDDPFRLKWYKRFKRIRHRITGNPIKHSIRYREIVRYFLLNNRLNFLSNFLFRFKEEEDTFYHSMRKILNKMNQHLDEIERMIWNQEAGWENATLIRELRKEIKEIRDTQYKLMKLQLGRMQLEFRRNLQGMTDEMGKIELHSSLKQKNINRKKYQQIRKNILEFEEEYHVQVENHLNKILMEFAVNAVKNRMETLHVDFNHELIQFINRQYFRELEKIQKILPSQAKIIVSDDVILDVDLEIELKDAFDQNISRMRDLVLQMADQYEIYSGKNVTDSQESDIITIPLARMTEHYLETRYITALEEKYDELIDLFKRSVYTIQDALNLTKFNLENYRSEGDGILEEIIDNLNQKIELEKEECTRQIDEYIQTADEYLERVFDPLSSFKIEESADHFIFGLRAYQGKRMLTGVNQLVNQIKEFGQTMITKFLYVQSEGILLSRKYTEDKSLRSTASRLLDLKDRVNPTREVLKLLPQFYISLFNGRSSIGDDFWIEREEEELKFKRAVERYQAGHRGGIMILGDRNMGKTAFCKYISQIYLKNQPIYSIFPSVSGTIHEEDFTEILSKATQKQGDVSQIANHLKDGSVIIINDLELFWERSSEGNLIIKLVERLIDEYSHKLLIIVNLNQFAFKVINQLSNLGTHFIEIINIKPFDAEVLKDLIMRRHRSSGFTFGFDQQTDGINEIRMAQLFNAYFNYSEGNPGTALYAWLANIKKVEADHLIVEKPENPSLSGLKSLQEDWLMLLGQFVIHKRLDLNKIIRITGWNKKEVNEMILALLRSGIIMEKVSGLYMIDPYIHPFVIRVLTDMDVL
jgi:amino acid transporter